MSDQQEQNTDKKKVKVLVEDRRFSAKKDRPEATENPSGKLRPTYVQELEGKVQAAEDKLKERLEEVDRENQAFRERLERDLERRVDEKLVDYLQPVMDMLDDLDRMLAASDAQDPVTQGVQMTRDKLLSGLARQGLTALRPEAGEPLDPNTMEACGMVPATEEAPPGTVQAVLQCGYRLGERVLAPARVTVSQG